MTGPRATLTISCAGCPHLVHDRKCASTLGCAEPSVVDANDGDPQLVGIGTDTTPVFCPFRVRAIERAVADSITRREAGRLGAALRLIANGGLR